MKAIVYHDKGDVRYHEDYDEPMIKTGEDVKIKIHYCGICGSDLKEYTDGPIFFNEKGEANAISGLSYPQAMGHEMSGEIVEIGDKVVGFEIGDKVVVEVTGTCQDRDRFPDAKNEFAGKCNACQDGVYNACDKLALQGLGVVDGGLADYCVTSYKKLIKFDESIIPMDVAALIQPIAVSWHAIKVSNFQPGQSALILGGGPIGLTTILALKGKDVKNIVVSEPSKIRRELAEKLGAIVFDPTNKSKQECIKELKQLSPDGIGFERSYDCSGVPITFDIALQCIKVRGCFTNVAIWSNKSVPVYPMELTLQEKFITGSICFVKLDFEEVVEALHQKRIPVDDVKLLITSKIHLSHGVKHGFDELVNHKERHVKILFSPKPEYENIKVGQH